LATSRSRCLSTTNIFFVFLIIYDVDAMTGVFVCLFIDE
jgi:hypothetical protein